MPERTEPSPAAAGDLNGAAWTEFCLLMKDDTELPPAWRTAARAIPGDGIPADLSALERLIKGEAHVAVEDAPR